MGFKELQATDFDNIMNANEFEETHNISGQNLKIIIDNDRLMKRSKIEYDGVFVGEILFFVKKSLLPSIKPEQIIVYDGKPMIVFDVREDMGVLEVILKSNEV